MIADKFATQPWILSIIAACLCIRLQQKVINKITPSILFALIGGLGITFLFEAIHLKSIEFSRKN